MSRLIKKFREGFTALYGGRDVSLEELYFELDSPRETRAEALFSTLGFISNPYNLYKTFRYRRDVGFKGGIAMDEEEWKEVRQYLECSDSQKRDPSD